MKFHFLIAAILLAAMGPSRTQPAPDPPPAETPAPPRAEPSAQRLHVLPAAEADPAEFLWQARPLVIFADTAADPAFLRQLRALEADPAPLIARDVVVITDTDPAAAGIWRRNLRPRGFSLVLVDKDGQVKQRKPAPWDVREISRAIDKFPLRRQEIGRAGLLP